MLRCLFRNAASIFNAERGVNVANFNTKASIPSQMDAWCLRRYGENNIPILDIVDVQTALKPAEVLVQVKAASVNPIDSLMTRGFASVTFRALRRLNKAKFAEFPVILGRDFSGVVVKRGGQVSRVKEGDEVCGRV